MAICDLKHTSTRTRTLLADLDLSQAGVGRHKCAGCAYERGLAQGYERAREQFQALLDRMEREQTRL